MSLLAVSPTLGEFSDYRAFVQADQKQSSRITKCSNYRGISVRALRKCLMGPLNFLLELMKVQKVDCSKTSTKIY